MAITLVVEDGTGLAGANTYITLAAADTYYEAHLYTTDWDGATDAQKNIALAMATRVLDQQFYWFGWKATTTQALQWPRADVPDPDRVAATYPSRTIPNVAYIASDSIPVFLSNAAAELAQMLIKKDRQKDPDGEGIREFVLTDVLEVIFDKTTKAPVIPSYIWSELLKYGSVAGGGSAKLQRA